MAILAYNSLKMVSYSWKFVLLIVCLHYSSALDLISTPGQLNQNYTNSTSVDVTQALVYTFDNETNEIGDLTSAKLRIEAEIVEMPNLNPRCPLLIAVQKGREVMSWVLPQYNAATNESYIRGARTLCIDPDDVNLLEVVLILSTCSEHGIKYNVRLSHDNQFIKKIGEEVEMYVSPTAPQYFRFDFPDDIDVVAMKVSSNEDHCMILSMQRPTCPIFDLESNIQYAGFWQTVTKKAGSIIEKKDFPDGVILVFSITTDDTGCEDTDGYKTVSRSVSKLNSIREKSVSFVIERALHQNEYYWPTFLPLVSYLPFLILTVAIFFVSHNYLYRHLETNSYTTVKTSIIIRSEKYMREANDELDNDIIRHLQKKSSKFVWSMITIAVFYCIPVFQLITNYLKIVERTGEHDVCYYNNLCSLPLGKVMDFNHIYSNIGYVIFGLIFMLFVRLRQLTVVRHDNDHKPVCFFLKKIVKDSEHGTYQHYGLYYCLGFALFMEGFLSAGYHICPNRSNFQFDTSFMYAMALLSTIKVYQFRHPLHMSETLIFISLAVVASCVVFGLLTASLAFRIVVSFGHIIATIGVQLYLAYDARTEVELEQGNVNLTFVRICKELVGLVEEPKYLTRHHPNKTLFWWTVCTNIILIILTWTILYGNNFATQVLYVLLFNLAIYVLYYGVMKTVHDELKFAISVQPLIYGILALIFWIPGLYLFMNPLSGWEDSPAESRTNNEECILAKFYDNHDIWHFLSAGGLFYSFMLFLTMDDMHIGTHQTQIPMF